MRKITLILLATLSCSFILADEMAPNDQCYIIISEKIPWSNALSIDIGRAIKKADINPKYAEVYQIWPDGDRYESLYVTVGKTYKETWSTNKNIFPSGTICSSGKGYMSNKMYYVAGDYSLKESKVRSSRGFLANADDYKEVTASYKRFLATEAAKEAAKEAKRLAEIEAAKEAKRIADAKAAEEAAVIKAAKEAAAIKAAEEAREITRIEAENRTRKRRIIIGVIILGFIFLGVRARKKEAERQAKMLKEAQRARKKEAERQAKMLKEAQDAGFESVNEFEEYIWKTKMQKEAQDEGFESVRAYESHLLKERRAKELHEAKLNALKNQPKDTKDTAAKGVVAGIATAYVAKKAMDRKQPPNVIFDDPNTRVTEMEYLSMLQHMGPGWKVRWKKFDRKGKTLSSGAIYGLKKGKTFRGNCSGGNYKVNW